MQSPSDIRLYPDILFDYGYVAPLNSGRAVTWLESKGLYLVDDAQRRRSAAPYLEIHYLGSTVDGDESRKPRLPSHLELPERDRSAGGGVVNEVG